MNIEGFSTGLRIPKQVNISGELVVVGAGLAGVCAAITAARQGVDVVLINDRPVLGGNASSEIRMWTLGATSHMGNNNRWAREGGVIDEILVENLYRNKEGNPLMFDTLLLEKVIQEENITLLLNTSVFEASKSNPDQISSVKAFCAQNSTLYEVCAPLFCDASGDGILGFCAGASFRMGAESKEEFGELFAPDESYGELLGHTIYFYSKDTGQPVDFVAPSFALKDIEAIPRFRNIQSSQQGCNFWWFEYGGRRDTIHETEEIKWELWKIVYGVWDYIKNSGNFPEAKNLTLEWVGQIPGKRESRRFEGPYMLHQRDVIEQTHFEDAVAFGGWSLDLHPSDAIYSDRPGCNQWHSKGLYEIPYRCFYSKNISNLFLAGRIISASHVAFGSSRVMATCAHGGQAVGMAAAMCVEKKLMPADVSRVELITELQERLNLTGQSIPKTQIEGHSNVLKEASIASSGDYELSGLKQSGNWRSLVYPAAQMIPMTAGVAYQYKTWVKAEANCQLSVELRKSESIDNHTPEVVLETQLIELKAGEQDVTISFSATVDTDQYTYICFFGDESISIAESDERMTGVLSVFRKENKEVSNFGKQEAPKGIGMDSFEFWIPERRPAGKNLAFEIEPAIQAFSVNNIKEGVVRPTTHPNAWVADVSDETVSIHFKWDEVKSFQNITIFFDPDYDHPMESVQMGHAESKMPFCVSDYRIVNDLGKEIYVASGNHQGINRIEFETVQMTESLSFHFEALDRNIPVSVFYIDVR